MSYQLINLDTSLLRREVSTIMPNILSSKTKLKQVEMSQVIGSSIFPVVLMLIIIIFYGVMEMSWLCRQGKTGVDTSELSGKRQDVLKCTPPDLGKIYKKETAL